jgi:hypothetical protein
MRLKDNHTWNAPEGYKILVVERGLVSFNFPESWLLVKMQPVEIHDGEPPDDNARLMMSFWRLPPGVDWAGLPLAPMLVQSVEEKEGEREILSTSEVYRPPRTDLEMVWLEQGFMDPEEHREAFSRIAIARGWDVQALVTFDFWATDRARFAPVWDECMRSLQLGRKIEDPTKGAVLQ